ncbi:MAG: nucleotide exchange factor GrpE [Candidatus Aenigmarchaeota archaeon]|nr:nucleotide exchange factor GrpE [Candidatus Aenigmarchaeota archaeon]
MTKKINKEKPEKKAAGLDAMKRELDEKTKLADERLEQIRYLRADFENYRKSLDREKAGLESNANMGFVKELLPLLDDLEAAVGKSGNSEASEGYKLMLKKLLSILFKSGLKPIESVGKRFDPYYHEAMMSTESDEPDGTVLEELQKGYMLNSNVIRHSKVRIAKNKKTGTEEDA